MYKIFITFTNTSITFNNSYAYHFASPFSSAPFYTKNESLHGKKKEEGVRDIQTETCIPNVIRGSFSSLPISIAMSIKLSSSAGVTLDPYGLRDTNTIRHLL